ncbi:MAG: hypothetical protein GX027_01335 [Clostridiaceae bacterium]|jgi:hypothetical protein|nr:hypothetical protein [Clostridiaceae bacterium]
MILKELALYAGILINAGYIIIKRYIEISDTVAIATGLVSIALIIAGLVFNIRRPGKGANHT